MEPLGCQRVKQTTPCVEWKLAPQHDNDGGLGVEKEAQTFP